jgi:predicted ArsR family transcriptional regulator
MSLAAGLAADAMPPKRPRAAPLRLAKRRDVHLEVLKLLKQHTLSRMQLHQQLGFNEMTVHYACAELEAQGFIVRRVADSMQPRKGRAPMLFTVAPAWGGRTHS